MSKIYLIYENEQWLAPLLDQLEALNAAYACWPMTQTSFDLMSIPPNGIFFNRMSASAHTRDHRYSPEYTGCVINWLQAHGRRVINGGGTLQLELSKSAQYSALSQAGIKVPQTQVVLGETKLIEVARQTQTPFIIKHNRAGKGLSVNLIDDPDALQAYVNGEDYQPPVDGLWLVQQYIQSPQPFITRLEFIAGKFVYAVKVNTEQGFELCPADACEMPDAFCPVDSTSADKFEIIVSFEHPLISQYEAFLKQHGIDIASFEFISDNDGVCYTYDINTNTNYNSLAESKSGIYAMHILAQYLSDELQTHR